LDTREKKKMPKTEKVGVKDAAKVEVTGKVAGKGKAALKADLNKLVAFTRSNKFKTMTGKKRVWSQIDNYRVALGTLKQEKRKSVSQNSPVGTTTYGKGKTKVAKEKGFSRDAGRGGGAKSTQTSSAKGKKPATGPYVTGVKREPNRKSPASTMATTNSKYTGGLSNGSDTRTGSENYAARRANNPALPKRSTRPRARVGKR
jgi:hypothetical protein